MNSFWSTYCNAENRTSGAMVALCGTITPPENSLVINELARLLHSIIGVTAYHKR